MVVIAKLKYLPISPRKVRLVTDMIKGKKVEEAQTVLRFVVKKASLPLSKLLKSGVANAKHNFQLDESNLYISKITVDEGPKYKRWKPRARGQAAEIQKKTSHITIVLDQIGKKPKEAKKTKKINPKIAKKIGEKEKIEKETSKIEKIKFRPRKEISPLKIEKGIKRVFRRKAF